MNINSNIIVRFCDRASRTSQSSVIHCKTLKTKLQNSNKNDDEKFHPYLCLQWSIVKFAVTAIASPVTTIALAVTTIALAVTAIALAVTEIALAVTEIALAVTEIALAVTTIALAVTTIALAVTKITTDRKL